jgi:hypothetical protein
VADRTTNKPARHPLTPTTATNQTPLSTQRANQLNPPRHSGKIMKIYQSKPLTLQQGLCQTDSKFEESAPVGGAG